MTGLRSGALAGLACYNTSASQGLLIGFSSDAV
jgi:hypothetical protein